MPGDAADRHDSALTHPHAREKKRRGHYCFWGGWVWVCDVPSKKEGGREFGGRS
jgi:hypothetical protein